MSEATITPADWAAKNPQSLEDAAIAVVDAVRNGEAALIDSTVTVFKTALLDSAGGTELDTVGAEFVRAYKGYKLFGDDLMVPAAKLYDLVKNKMTDDSQEPYLYILMRTDLASMNPGKAVAQGSHAANQMVIEAYGGAPVENEDPRKRLLRFAAAMTNIIEENKPEDQALIDWLVAANGFGTCIVLGVSEFEMRETIALAKSRGHHAAITHDPSYPLRDGASFLAVPLDTCGYIFGKKGDLRPIVGGFGLMK